MSLQQTSNSFFPGKFVAMIMGGIVVLGVMGIFSPAYALTLSPARIEINGDAGTTVGGEFTLINEQSTTQTFYASYENFSAQGETGAPAFSADQNGLDTWLGVVPPQVTLAPGQVVKIPYTIAIPAGTDSGGYFAAIFWSSTPPSSETNQVSIGAKVGLLVLLRVNGAVTESAGINLFDRNGHGFFYNTLPVTLRYKFRNNGGDRVQPAGTVTVRDTVFLPAATLDANAAQGNILPNSVRQFTVPWLKQAAAMPPQGFFATVSYQWQNFAVGLYSAHLDVMYGSENLHAKSIVWFFVFPWQLVLCMIAVFTVVFGGGRIGLKRYNAYIIKKYKNQ